MVHHACYHTKRAIIAATALMIWATGAPAIAKDDQTLDAQKSALEQGTPLAHTPPRVMGWIETAMIPDISDTTRAKLDSGAKTSAINADIIKIFKRNKKEYVLFRVDLDRRHSKQTIERRVVRWVKIKLKEGGLQKRPVVRMKLCLGTTLLDGEISLSKRDHFNYNILIGRNMLTRRILVDTSRTFTIQPSCKVS